MAFFSFPAQVNEYAARTVAATVASLLIVSFALGFAPILPFLAVGFLLRVGWGPRFSPLARLASEVVAPRLWPVKPVSGPPKRFAQGIGAVFTVTATVLWLTGHLTAAWGFAGVIVVFASLEAIVPFCMGCWVYGRLQGAGLFPADVCVDCAPQSRRLRPS
jgi:hypothetical protein